MKQEKSFSCFFQLAGSNMKKVSVIFGFFSILNKIGVIPEKAAATLATAMGITQIITATIGMFASSIIYEIENKTINKVG